MYASIDSSSISSGEHERLVVEVDGWESHGTRSAFEDDRARDARLKLLGFDVLRFTWRQVEDDWRLTSRKDHPRRCSAQPREQRPAAPEFRLGPNLGWPDGFDRGGSSLPG